MGRPPRIYVEEALYFVTCRGVHNQQIFISPSDYKDYIDLIAEYKKLYGFKLFAYSLSAGQIYLLIELKNNITISNIVRDINSRYTKIFNRRHNKKGNLFQTRFRAVIAEKKSFLLPLIRYILLSLNYLDSVIEPEDFLHSNYRQFLEPDKRRYPDLSQEIEEVFTFLEGREEDFSKFFESMNKEKFEKFKKKIGKKRILGSKEFAAYIKKIIEDTQHKQERKKRLPKRLIALYATSIIALISISVLVINHFYRQSLDLRTEYDRTLALYKETLNVLKQEQKEAQEAQGDIEDYQWKIRLAEQALEKLQAERDKIIQSEKEIEGFSWIIKLSQIGGSRQEFPDIDTISFVNNVLISENMEKRGFTSPKYSMRQLQGGKVLSWEATQSNPQGDRVSWRGKWDGNRLRGVISMRLNNGIAMDFSFVSMGERSKR